MKNIQSTIMKFIPIKTVLLCFLLMSTLMSFGKQVKSYPLKQITGKVTDAVTGNPLAGVHIQAYNNPKYAAFTGEDGLYSIKVPDFVTSLLLNLEDYNLVQCPINNRLTDVDMTMTTNDFAELYQVKTSATKSKVATDFGLTNEISIEPLIQSKLGSDVRTTIRSGISGMGASMFMNGLTSITANAQPLVVLDGVLLDLQYDRLMVHDGYFNNILSNININDIESVTVVKNGTAIYGANGANGVLLIDTKRNQSMTTKIDLTIAGGVEMIPTMPSMMNNAQYSTYAAELLGSTGTTLTDFKFLKEDPTYYYYKQYHNNTDWTKSIFQNALTQNYGINVQGGDDVANYNLSVGYTYGNSTLMKNDFSRFNLRLNSDINLFKNFTTRFDASFSDIQRNLRDDGVTDDFNASTVTSPGFLSLIKSPFLNPYAYDTKGRLSSYYSEADDYLDEVIGTNVSLANPCSILKYGEANNKNSFSNSIINLAITPRYQFNKYLSVSEHFSYTTVNTYENYYLPMTGVPSFTLKDVGVIHNIAKSLSSKQNEFFSDFKIQWKNSYGAHSFQAVGGSRFMNNSYTLNLQKGYNTGNDKMPNMSLSLYDKNTSGADDQVRSFTNYASLAYNYQEKLYLNAALSMESSSSFGKDVKDGIKFSGVVWGLFPSIQGTWVVTSEPWFKNTKTLNHLKLNVGYDVSGNDDIDQVASRSYFTPNNMLTSIDGLSMSNIGNTTLQWETTKRFTGGVEMNMFQNKLNLQLNAFKGWTSNLLNLKKLAFVSGLAYNWSNDGSLENAGYDVSFNAKVLNLKNFKFDIGASVASYLNRITSLSDNNSSFMTNIYGATILSQVGSPVGVFYGYKTDGVYATTAQANADGYYIVSSNGARKYFKAGDIRFINSGNDQEINESDRTIIGDPNPDYFGNIFANMNYKKLSLNVVFNYSIGNDVFNYQRSVLESGSRFFNQTTALTNRWTTEGQETSIPKINYEDAMGNARFSDRWIEDGSFLRLKALTLSYAVPVNNMYIKGYTIWGSVTNLITWTKYLGSDPEFSLGNSALAQGIDRGLLAQGRNFSLGLKINL